MVSPIITLAHQPTELFCEAAEMSYLAIGEGSEAVLLLHGWSAFKELWWSTLVALGPHARAYAPDMPGHGGSPLHGSVRMDLLAQRVLRFCEARGLESLTLVGHSMGGNVALELALARPALVRRLVLVDPAAEAARMPLYTRSYLADVYGWAALRASLEIARRLEPLGQRVPHNHGGGLVRPALRRMAYWARHDADALRGLLGGLFANSIGERTSGIRMPTLVISGEFDPLVPPVLSRRLAESIPNARYALIRGAGHNPMDERPREFERVLLEFLGL